MVQIITNKNKITHLQWIKFCVNKRINISHITKYGGATMLLFTKQDMILMNRIRYRIGGMMLI